MCSHLFIIPCSYASYVCASCTKMHVLYYCVSKLCRFSVKLYKIIQPSFLRFLPVCILLVFDESESLLLFDFRCWQNVNWQKLTNTSQNLTRVSFLLFASPGICRQNSTSHNLTLRWNVSFLSASFDKNWHPLHSGHLSSCCLLRSLWLYLTIFDTDIM